MKGAVFLCVVIMLLAGGVAARHHTRHPRLSRLSDLLNVEESEEDGFMTTDEEIAALPPPKLDLSLPAFPDLPTEQKEHRRDHTRTHRRNGVDIVEREFEAEAAPRFRSVHSKAKKQHRKRRSHIKPRYYASTHPQSQQSAQQLQMRFAQQLDRRFATAPTTAATAAPTMMGVPQLDYFRPSVISQGEPLHMMDALFAPLHPLTPPTSANGQPFPPAPSLTADISNYIYAYAPQQPYTYPMPPKIPLILDNPVTPAIQPGAPSLLETHASVGSTTTQQQQQSSQQLLRPYDPSSVPAWVAGRSPTVDMAQSGYQTFSQQNWPSSVAPPAAYYLPPDVVGI